MTVECSLQLHPISTAVPGAPPQSVSVNPESSFSIRVVWSQPPVDQRNGPITSYSIVYGVHPSLETAQSNTIRSVASPQYLGQLSPYMEYYVKVAASTVNGTGPYSIIDMTKTFAYSELYYMFCKCRTCDILQNIHITCAIVYKYNRP